MSQATKIDPEFAAEWMTSNDASTMLPAITDMRDRLGWAGAWVQSGRKIGLFAAAVDNRLCDDGVFPKLISWQRSPDDAKIVTIWVTYNGIMHPIAMKSARAADLLREIIGNPFLGIRTCNSPGHELTSGHLWRGRITDTVKSAAKAIDLERTYSECPVLADALEDAGCMSNRILEHLRGPNVHIRGCWVLDLIING